MHKLLTRPLANSPGVWSEDLKANSNVWCLLCEFLILGWRQICWSARKNGSQSWVDWAHRHSYRSTCGPFNRQKVEKHWRGHEFYAWCCNDTCCVGPFCWWACCNSRWYNFLKSYYLCFHCPFDLWLHEGNGLLCNFLENIIAGFLWCWYWLKLYLRDVVHSMCFLGTSITLCMSTTTIRLLLCVVYVWRIEKICNTTMYYVPRVGRVYIL